MKFPPIIRLLWLTLACRLVSASLVSSDSRRSPYPRYAEYNGNYSEPMRGLNKGPFHYIQFLDHDDVRERPPTFRQRYWINDAYYVGKGPIFVIISDVSDVSMFDPISMFVEMAKRNKGMLVLLELRYHGESFPVGDLSEDNLKYLTTRQLLADIADFAETGMNKSPFEASKVPWVLIGGSFPGGYPRIFWAGYSSSGMVQAKADFWQFFDDTGRKMPLNCARDIQKVIKYFDRHAASDDERVITELKEDLGLTQIKHIDDVAGIMAYDVAHWLRVDYLVRPKDRTRFDKLCDTLEEDRRGKIVPPSRRDTNHLLNAWRRWNLREHASEPDETWTTHDSNAITYKSLERDNARVWRWLQCNEYGWFYTAPPSNAGTDRVVSRLVTLQREKRICSFYFPKTYRFIAGPATNATNTLYGGWNKLAKRVFIATGGRDPYRGVTFQERYADFPTAPMAYKKNGHHMSDFVDTVGGGTSDIQELGQRKIKDWLSDWRYMQIIH